MLNSAMDDPEALRLYAEQNRVLVIRDCHTMPGHFVGFIKHQDSPVIFIVSRKFSVGKAVEWLMATLGSERSRNTPWSSEQCLHNALLYR
ncbi:MAG: hypothetical protein M3430_00955 [Acidobacteriota bacterium]|nr:hypothetical protein [Acidobacteriota bacterium]